MTKRDDRNFLLGFAAAIATLARDHGEQHFAAMIAAENGVTLADLRAAGVEEFDLRPLRQEMREMERRKLRSAPASPSEHGAKRRRDAR